MNEHTELPVEPLTESATSSESAEVEANCAPAAESNGSAFTIDADQSQIPTVTAPKAPKGRRRKEVDDWMGGIQWLCSTVVLAVFVITFLAQAFQIPSDSMENTLLVGDYLLVDKVHYGESGMWNWLMPYSPIHRGDIIVFRYPVHPQQHFVKRVVGVPGDRVHLFRGKVFVNDKALDDSAFAMHKGLQFDSYRDNFPSGNYISPEVNSSWWVEMHNVLHNGDIVVPPGNFFVLGDNRDDSLDSRYWGFVPRENITGRPFLIYWSVQQEETAASDGRLERLLYTLVHLPEDARWDRTFHLVR